MDKIRILKLFKYVESLLPGISKRNTRKVEPLWKGADVEKKGR